MTIKRKLAALPSKPGVYLFKNSQGNILYVGKAKSLRPRVQSYFRQAAKLDTLKQKMVKKITSLDTITCDTETEALVLEANLIRQYQPPYNVLLRDDKFYQFIKVTTNEDQPRVFSVRQLKNDGARYFGPYSSGLSVKQTLKLLRRIFPHRGEKQSPREKVFPHPLFAQQPDKSSAYQENIYHIIHFLQGNRRVVLATLKQGMKQAAKAKQYERAAIFRDQLRAIARLEGSQKVYLPHRESFDILSIVSQPNISAANIFSIRQGKLLNKNTFLLKHRSSSQPADVLRQFTLQYYQVAQDIPKLILTPLKLDDQTTIAHFINPTNPPAFATPQRGKKKQLMTMGELNAKQLLSQETTEFAHKSQINQALQELTTTLKLPTPPKRIETYDISNIQGRLATGSMVVFTDGQPNKNQYRKFKIKLGDTPNDYAMMKEVLQRRFSNHHQDWPLPNLILIDGGRGQLNAAQSILTKLKLPLSLASLAKHEEDLFTTNQPSSIRLPYDSPALFLIQQMRDEAHRFTISYHRLLRSKQQKRSILDEIPNVGPKTKKKLLNHFGSLKAIRAASDKELTKIIGPSKTTTLRDWL